ncbi:spermidine synthase [Gimesia alba]|uniref:Spermidine synthase n=1 Tax=Gimesia alba TaxID=2527973 RepID=A0A517RPH7_9PLAN|nr:class I SAM-dependent methyltransferase [Gimesia alba]QDT45791.1 spermidine synthase [Gimesia alba]
MNFNRVAPYFERLEKIVFNKQMQRCRTAFLTHLPPVKKIVLVGEGNGQFLLELIQHTDCEQIHYIDSSQTMLELARKRLQRFSEAASRRVTFYLCDLTVEEMPDQNYDLVVTNFFLDVFDKQLLNEMVTKIAEACETNAVWLYADFQISGGIFQRVRAFTLIKIMYMFFRFVAQIQTLSLIDPSEILDRHEFRLIELMEFDRGLIRAELRQRD